MNRSSQGVGFAPSFIGGSPVRRQPRGPVVGTGFSLLLILAFLTTLGGLSGCAALGLQAPQGFNEKLAAGYTGVTAVREAALTLLTNGVITVDEAKAVQAKSNDVRAALDSASSLKGIDFKEAENRMASALRVLVTLQDFVAGRQSGKTVEVPR